jgi:HK97 gp10 family phage protein
MPRITGAQGVTVHLNRIASEETVRKVGAALLAGAEEIRAEAFAMISEGSVSGRGHIASLPGEPPNRDSGVLQAHLESVQTAPLAAEVSSNAPYAVALEFGTSKMAERPYMRPATNRKRKDVVALVRRAVNEAIKSSKA